VHAVEGGWRLLDAAGQELASADLAVLAAALGTDALTGGRLPLAAGASARCLHCGGHGRATVPGESSASVSS